MNRDPETPRVVRSWLEDGVTVLPDRVLDAVLDQLPATPQRRSWWPARRLPEMNTAIKLALGAAAVLAVSLLGLNLLGDGSAPAVGAASPAPSVSPSPSPSPEPTPGSSPVPSPPALPADGRPVSAGEYYVPVTTTLRAILDVPDGMIFDGAWIRKPGDDWPAGSALLLTVITNVTVDPCTAEWLDPPVGGGVDALVEAFSTRDDFVDGSTGPASVDGHLGQRLLLTTPEDVDFEACVGTQYTDWIVTDRGARWRAGGPGQTLDLRIVDVDGERVVIEIASAPETPAEDLAELEAIVDSIRFVTP